jgi:hypothetical protein
MTDLQKIIFVSGADTEELHIYLNPAAAVYRNNIM